MQWPWMRAVSIPVLSNNNAKHISIGTAADERQPMPGDDVFTPKIRRKYAPCSCRVHRFALHRALPCIEHLSN